MSGLSVLLVLWGTPAIGQPPAAAEAHSYLYQPAFVLDEKLRGTASPYALQAGDICFAVNNHVLSRIGHQLAGAGLPNHSMIIFAYPDAHLGIVEAGPHSELAIRVRDAYAHLGSYVVEGSRVWVRRRRDPLTPEQSAALTAFCLAQADKSFPVVRLVGQLSPLRSRGPIRTAWMGRPNLDRNRYFCSELVLNALVGAGVLDAASQRPAASYPSDLFYSTSRNRRVDRGVRQLACDWDAPARWVTCPEAGPPEGPAP